MNLVLSILKTNREVRQLDKNYNMVNKYYYRK